MPSLLRLRIRYIEILANRIKNMPCNKCHWRFDSIFSNEENYCFKLGKVASPFTCSYFKSKEVVKIKRCTYAGPQCETKYCAKCGLRTDCHGPQFAPQSMGPQSYMYGATGDIQRRRKMKTKAKDSYFIPPAFVFDDSDSGSSGFSGGEGDFSGGGASGDW